MILRKPKGSFAISLIFFGLACSEEAPSDDDESGDDGGTSSRGGSASGGASGSQQQGGTGNSGGVNGSGTGGAGAQSNGGASAGASTGGANAGTGGLAGGAATSGSGGSGGTAGTAWECTGAEGGMMCNCFENRAAEIGVTVIAKQVPEGSGGPIRDGLYVMTSIKAYDTSPFSPGFFARETAVFDQGVYASNGETSGTQGIGPYRTTYRFTTSENQFIYDLQCTSLSFTNPPPSQYSATETEVTLISFGTATTYTRQ